MITSDSSLLTIKTLAYHKVILNKLYLLSEKYKERESSVRQNTLCDFKEIKQEPSEDELQGANHTPTH